MCLVLFATIGLIAGVVLPFWVQQIQYTDYASYPSSLVTATCVYNGNMELISGPPSYCRNAVGLGSGVGSIRDVAGGATAGLMVTLVFGIIGIVVGLWSAASRTYRRPLLLGGTGVALATLLSGAATLASGARFLGLYLGISNFRESAAAAGSPLNFSNPSSPALLVTAVIGLLILLASLVMLVKTARAATVQPPVPAPTPSPPTPGGA